MTPSPRSCGRHSYSDVWIALAGKPCGFVWELYRIVPALPVPQAVWVLSDIIPFDYRYHGPAILVVVEDEEGDEA